MSLPVMDVPRYSTTLPSTGERVEYRPFLVREQKNLLVAVAGDADQQLQALMNTVAACTFGRLDLSRCSAYDIEYLFVQIRARSIGENIDIVARCSQCETPHEQRVDLTGVEVQRPQGHVAEVELSNGTVMRMRDPGLEAVDRYRRAPGPAAVLELMAHSIESIWKDDTMYAALDYTVAELVEFVENLSPRDLAPLERFFETLPSLRHEFSWTCKNCGTDNRAVLEGLQGFFV